MRNGDGVNPDNDASIILDDGSSYVGQVKDNKPHGYGTFVGVDGIKYIGEWVRGHRHGKGKFHHSVTGIEYSGEFKNDKINGYGVRIIPDQETYEGEWRNDLPHGQGRCLHSNGEVYSGNWENGKMSGYGKITAPNGTKYIGEFKAGARHGWGKYLSDDGFTYEGEWENDLKHGCGRITNPDHGTGIARWEKGEMVYCNKMNMANGDEYSGDIKDGELCGQGKMVYKDGSIYEGEFKNSAPNGRGIFTLSLGHIYEGEVVEGIPHGYGKWTYTDGKKYEGYLIEGEYEGWGTLTSPDNVNYEGEWKKGARNGKGTQAICGGSKYEGIFNNNSPIGQGWLLLPDGSYTIGEWINGDFVSLSKQDDRATKDNKFFSATAEPFIDEYSPNYTNLNTDFCIDFKNGRIPIGDLPIGARVVDTSWAWEFRLGLNYSDYDRNGNYIAPAEVKPVTWIVVAKNHYERLEPHVTLLSEELIGLFAYDDSTDRDHKYAEYGYNHWGESGTAKATRGLRPWLNSSGIHSGEGFYQAFSKTFKEAVLPTKVMNKMWQNGSDYSTIDQVYIPLTTELGDMEPHHTYQIGKVYPYFVGLGKARRLAKLGGDAWLYWTRSPDTDGGYRVRRVNYDNRVFFDSSPACKSLGVRPALNMKSNICGNLSPGLNLSRLKEMCCTRI